MFDETDILLILALALGKSREDAGRIAGIEEDVVAWRLDSKAEEYERVVARVAVPLNERKIEIETLTREQYAEKRGKLRGKALAVKELALDAAILNTGDLDALTLGNKVADAIEDRDFGKPKEVKEVRARHELVVWNPQPLRKLAREERDMLDSDDLLALLPADAIEAEVVET